MYGQENDFLADDILHLYITRSQLIFSTFFKGAFFKLFLILLRAHMSLQTYTCFKSLAIKRKNLKVVQEMLDISGHLPTTQYINDAF